jgi:glycerol-3-phosphate dehydrogenase
MGTNDKLCHTTTQRSAMAAASSASPKQLDAVVIGCGVVGVAVGRALALAGLSVLIVEKEAAPFGGASGNNSGIVCTGFDAPRQGLERRCLRLGREELLGVGKRGLDPRVFDPRGAIIADFGASEHPLAPPSLSEDEAYGKLETIVDECLEVGDARSEVLDAAGVADLENGVDPSVRAAALIAGEIVFDPFLLPLALLREAKCAGAELWTSSRVVEAVPPSACSPRAEVAARALNALGVALPVRESERSTPWQVRVERMGEVQTLSSALVFNCGGNRADYVSASRTEPCSWRMRPRKGQYVVLAPLASGGKAPLFRPLQPLPSLKTKGVYIFPPSVVSSDHPVVVVGPTATDVEAVSEGLGGVEERDHAVLCVHTERELATFAQYRLSDVCLEGDAPTWGVLGRYGGLRPAIEGRRDYRIHHEGEGWWDVSGIRSTGASASAGIGRLVACASLVEAAASVGGDEPERALAEVVLGALEPSEHLLDETEGLHSLAGLVWDCMSEKWEGNPDSRGAVEAMFWSTEEEARAMSLSGCGGRGGVVDFGDDALAESLEVLRLGGGLHDGRSSILAACCEVVEHLSRAAAFKREMTEIMPLDLESSISEFCSSLREDAATKGLDLSRELCRPAHLWRVTGSIHVDGQLQAVTHSMTKLVWAHVGGLLNPVVLCEGCGFSA